MSSCANLNSAGLSYYREQGVDASARIINAAIVNDVLASSLSGGDFEFSALSLYADEIASIDDKLWYRTADVDACIRKMNSTLSLAVDAPFIGYFCNLEPDHRVMDSPLPEL